MLILAGVSISAIVGEDGLITKAQQASFANKLATYNEEFEMNAVEAITEEGIDNRDKITLMNEYVKQYVPSLEDNDIGQFAIINGQLYYVGDEELEREVCKSQGYNTLPEGMTVEEFASSIESNAVESVLKNMVGNAFYESKEDGTNGIVGVALANKVGGTFGSTQHWQIITEVENGQTKATYASGWYYVESGSTVEGIGILKNSYIINYTNRKAVKFDANKHTIITNGSNVAVTDGMVFNADPTNMMSGDRTSWGNAILHGFSNTEYNEDGTVKSGWTKDAFVTDGKDDFIEIPSDNIDSINGFTIEFYGRVISNDACYLFSKANSSGAISTLGYWNSDNTLWYGGNHRHFKLDESSIYNKDIYISLCYPNEDYDVYTLGDVIKNGKVLTGEAALAATKKKIPDSFGFGNVRMYNNLNLLKPHLDREVWDGYDSYVNFITSNAPFYFGTGNGGNLSLNASGYTALKIYAIRVYNRELSYSECVANYNATVSYHNILVNDGNASTGGNTGGEDIETIE